MLCQLYSFKKTKHEPSLRQSASQSLSVSRLCKDLSLNCSSLTGIANYYTILDLDPINVANQITLLEEALFKEIKPTEFMHQNWLKNDKAKLAPNILAMVKHSTQMSEWVVSEILSLPEITQRTSAIRKFIQCAQQCQRVNNYNGVIEIIGGLQNTAVYRLTKSWEGVGEYRSYIEGVLCLQQNNFKKLRHAISQAVNSVIPYLGIYLTDLVHIDDGNSNFVGNMVNFVKCRLLADRVKEILQYQQEHYDLMPSKIIQHYLLSYVGINPNEAFRISKMLEP